MLSHMQVIRMLCSVLYIQNTNNCLRLEKRGSSQLELLTLMSTILFSIKTKLQGVVAIFQKTNYWKQCLLSFVGFKKICFPVTVVMQSKKVCE